MLYLLFCNNFLLKHEVKLIIVACNTSSSVALRILEKNFKVPVLGVIKPGARELVRVTKNNKVAVIGTKTTIKSRSYENEIKLLSKHIKVHSVSCPLFVPLVEEGWFENSICEQVANEYLSGLRGKGIDAIVLGCTHYPLLKPILQKTLGKEVTLVDSAAQVVKDAKRILKKEKLLSLKGKKGKVSFYVSDEPESFAASAKQFLGFKLKNIRKVLNV